MAFSGGKISPVSLAPLPKKHEESSSEERKQQHPLVEKFPSKGIASVAAELEKQLAASSKPKNQRSGIPFSPILERRKESSLKVSETSKQNEGSPKALLGFFFGNKKHENDLKASSDTPPPPLGGVKVIFDKPQINSLKSPLLTSKFNSRSNLPNAPHPFKKTEDTSKDLDSNVRNDDILNNPSSSFLRNKNFEKKADDNIQNSYGTARKQVHKNAPKIRFGPNVDFATTRDRLDDSHQNEFSRNARAIASPMASRRHAVMFVDDPLSEFKHEGKPAVVQQSASPHDSPKVEELGPSFDTDEYSVSTAPQGDSSKKRIEKSFEFLRKAFSKPFAGKEQQKTAHSLFSSGLNSRSNSLPLIPSQSSNSLAKRQYSLSALDGAGVSKRVGLGNFESDFSNYLSADPIQDQVTLVVKTIFSTIRLLEDSIDSQEEALVFFRAAKRSSPIPTTVDSSGRAATVLRSAVISGQEIHFGRLSYVGGISDVNHYVVFAAPNPGLLYQLTELLKTQRGLDANNDYWGQWKLIIDMETGTFSAQFRNNLKIGMLNLKKILLKYVSVKSKKYKDVAFKYLPKEFVTAPCELCQKYEAVSGAVAMARQFLPCYRKDLVKKPMLFDVKTDNFIKWNPVMKIIERQTLQATPPSNIAEGAYSARYITFQQEAKNVIKGYMWGLTSPTSLINNPNMYSGECKLSFVIENAELPPFLRYSPFIIQGPICIVKKVNNDLIMRCGNEFF